MTEVIRLVKSLSKVEKRQFKLATKKQTGRKDYLDLFDVIDQCEAIDIASIKNKFNQTHPDTLPDNAANYLFDLLTDNLITSKIKNDTSFQLLHGLMRVRLLEERSIATAAHKELIKLEHIATSTQDRLLQYFIYQKQMEQLAEINFKEITEKQLIKTQMNGRMLIKDLHNIHEHQSLYELLKYRLTHSGNVLSEEDKKKLNDLILNEIGLITGRIKQDYESKKLHLLFQSFFFTFTGEYKSALKTYYSLNRLFEQNTQLWNNPPVGYFSALDGILDSLRTNEHFNEMDFYIQKMEHLNNKVFPEYFFFLLQKTITIYRLVVLLKTGQLDQALSFLKGKDIRLLQAYKLVDEEKQNELSFYVALTFFLAGNYKKAHKYINEVILIGTTNYQSVVYRACQLLSLLITYEAKNDLEYLDYAIRSHKRSLQKKSHLLKTEKLIFKTIQINPDMHGRHKNQILWKKVTPLVLSIEKDKYEKQLLKYYDFVGWSRKRFEINTIPK